MSATAKRSASRATDDPAPQVDVAPAKNLERPYEPGEALFLDQPTRGHKKRPVRLVAPSKAVVLEWKAVGDEVNLAGRRRPGDLAAAVRCRRIAGHDGQRGLGLLRQELRLDEHVAGVDRHRERPPRHVRRHPADRRGQVGEVSV